MLTLLMPASLHAQRTMTNTAMATYSTPAGIDTVVSPTVATIVTPARLSLTKVLVGPTTARIDDVLEYRIRYANTSIDVAAVNVRVVDTLASGLEIVSSFPAAGVSGRAATWSVGELAPGASADISLKVRVSGTANQTARIRNTAVLLAQNAETQTATAEDVSLVGDAAAAIKVVKTADALEVGLGETAPYTLVLENTGTMPLGGVEIYDRLPEGARYVAGSVAGADSTRSSGQDLKIFLPGTLVPGEKRTVRYQVAIVSAGADVLDNTAIASANEGTVVSAPATASIRIRRSMPMGVRTAFGKVWSDLNRNGRQEAEEPGVKGVEVWTENGEVATTDTDGRFSFRNLGPGRHAFRLDQSTVPKRFMGTGRDGVVDVVIKDATGWTTPRVSFGLFESAPLTPPDSTADSAEKAPVGPSPAAPPAVSIKAMRSATDRLDERRQAITRGPGVEFFAPADGAVARTDRIYVGVRGQPGAVVALFDGDSLIANATTRIDGIVDFVAIPLAAGPHRLRVRLTNSWPHDRWDSAAVHVTGIPSRFVPERPVVRLAADGQATALVRIRVLDSWGVPVVNGALITVAAVGATLVNGDDDRSSVGIQVKTDAEGWITASIRAGQEVRRGRVTLKAARAAGEVPLHVVAATRPLMVTGVGRVGVGSSADAFGAITARGRLDDRTSLTLAYDSRRLDAGNGAFGRVSDPLDPAQYPMLGDASTVRSVIPARSVFSARLESGFDWLAVGDVTTTEFAAGLQMGAYRRSLTGAATRLTKGPLTLHGFASATSQMVRHQQIRGEGISGPYRLDGRAIAGTDAVAIETRAAENAQRVVSRQVLVRFVDYQIDYERGTLLLKSAVPAADTYGNPVYLVITAETVGGGPRGALWGVRAIGNAGQVLGSSALDSAHVGLLWVQQSAVDGSQRLAGVDLRLLRGKFLDVTGEVFHSQSPDSSGLATSLRASLRLFNDAMTVKAGWMQAGEGFQNHSNLSIRGGSEEISVGAALRFGSSGELRIQKERQRFEAASTTRERALVGIVQSVGSKTKLESSLVEDSYRTGATTEASRAAEVKATWNPVARVSLWSEARKEISHEGSVIPPDYLGVGASYKVANGISLEARRREVNLPGDSASYAITNFGIRSHVGDHTELWSSYQLAGADGSHNSAVVGVNNKLQLRDGMSLKGMFERRQGLRNAALADPLRALPFLQEEEDYTAFGLGIDLHPKEAPYQMTLRAEHRDGELRSVRNLEMTGDVSIRRSLAFLTRADLLRTQQSSPGQPGISRRHSILSGLAFRPVKGDALNMLAKIEYVSEINPLRTAGLAPRGEESRKIAALEGVWALTAGSEFSFRIATRMTSAALIDSSAGPSMLRSSADYLGGRASVDIMPRLSARVDGRVLSERTSRVTRWDVAPQISLAIGPIEPSFGYRFGSLVDVDFGASGGSGLFFTVGAKLTESTARTVADVWRKRIDEK